MPYFPFPLIPATLTVFAKTALDTLKADTYSRCFKWIQYHKPQLLDTVCHCRISED